MSAQALTLAKDIAVISLRGAAILAGAHAVQNLNECAIRATTAALDAIKAGGVSDYVRKAVDYIPEAIRSAVRPGCEDVDYKNKAIATVVYSAIGLGFTLAANQLFGSSSPALFSRVVEWLAVSCPKHPLFAMVGL